MEGFSRSAARKSRDARIAGGVGKAMSKIETLKATRGAGKREIYIVASDGRPNRPQGAVVKCIQMRAEIRKKRSVRVLRGRTALLFSGSCHAK